MSSTRSKVRFGERLKSLRKRAGLSQAQLAHRASVSRKTIEAYEQGSRQPTWNTVQKLAAALGVPVSAFAE